MPGTSTAGLSLVIGRCGGGQALATVQGVTGPQLSESDVHQSAAADATVPIPVGGVEWVLSRGSQELIVCEVGGGVRRYTVGGVDVLDGYERGELPPGCRGQILAPWCNRVRDGSYRFDGADLQLDISEPKTNCALHGLFRWLPVIVTGRGSDWIEVHGIVHARAGYPFTVELDTRWSLTDDGLRVTHTARNLGPTAAPFSLATHCYLSTAGGVEAGTLHVPAATYLPTDERLLPLPAQPVAGTRQDFRTGHLFGDLVLDTAYTDLQRGPDGLVRASVTGPDGRGGQVWADGAFDWLQVYSSDTQHGDRFRHAFAVEPMTAPADAFNSGTDLVVIEPAGRWTGTWGIRPLGHAMADPAARAAFLAEELLSTQTEDDRVDPGDRAAQRSAADADERLTREVPPHHGG
jgi:aldose 1-epimerase